MTFSIYHVIILVIYLYLLYNYNFLYLLFTLYIKPLASFLFSQTALFRRKVSSFD